MAGMKKPVDFFHMYVALCTGAAATTDTDCAAKDGTTIKKEDTIIWCGHFSTAAAIATLEDRTDEVSVVNDGHVQLSTTDTTSDQLLVIWHRGNS